MRDQLLLAHMPLLKGKKGLEKLVGLCAHPSAAYTSPPKGSLWPLSSLIPYIQPFLLTP
jgi:hypothetical protein